MPDIKPSSTETNIDEAVAPYFAGVHIGMISIVQGFALSILIQQNVVEVPNWADWDWPYFLRGLSVFFLAIALWHAYVTQLAYVATLHWLHTLFPFSFGVLQFMLASKKVLQPSIGWHNLSYFMFLMSITAITGAAAYANTLYHHKSNRTKMRFNVTFGEQPQTQELYGFWGKVHCFFAYSMVVTFIVFLILAAVAKWQYMPCEEIVFPAFTATVAAFAIIVDARFLAEHFTFSSAVKPIYQRVYGKAATQTGDLPHDAS